MTIKEAVEFYNDANKLLERLQTIESMCSFYRDYGELPKYTKRDYFQTLGQLVSQERLRIRESLNATFGEEGIKKEEEKDGD